MTEHKKSNGAAVAKRKVSGGKRGASSILLSILVHFSIFFTFLMLLLVIGQVCLKGIPNLTPDVFNPKWTTDNQSMVPAMVNTLELILITLLLCVPIGVATAIYMVEYAHPESKFVRVVRVMTETLQGIPSIIYGLFGLIFFSNTLGWGNSIMSGALTMVLMCLPLIIRATEESLLSVPNSLREASYGLGARKLRTIFRVVLPAAAMGIFSGIILAIGRIVGETAALIYTAGSMSQYAGPFNNGRTLAIHMYLLSTEGIFNDQAWATAFILLVVVFLINALSTYMEKTLKNKEEGNE